MKRSAAILLTIMTLGCILTSCRTKDSCPAYGSNQVKSSTRAL
jgi:hypothetical protein